MALMITCPLVFYTYFMPHVDIIHGVITKCISKCEHILSYLSYNIH